jgi:hypothetical protein
MMIEIISKNTQAAALAHHIKLGAKNKHNKKKSTSPTQTLLLKARDVYSCFPGGHLYPVKQKIKTR